MEEQLAHADDSSHYEISLTAGQAFMAFVLLLLSLAASFAFGLMIGKGQADERLVVRKETPVVTEGSVLPPKGKTDRGEIVELGVTDDDFQETDPAGDEATSPAPVTDSAVTVAETAAPSAPVTTAAAEPVVVREADPAPAPAPAAAAPPTQNKALTPTSQTPAQNKALTPTRAQSPTRAHVTTYAQLLSTGDQKSAEALASRLIDRGFLSAYVERGSTEKGPIFRVRVKFATEGEARAAEPKLKEFSNDVWITAR
ncbi:MAG TPA: SPOR domain-containing protein [Thermoanaerobaculia bacterium]